MIHPYVFSSTLLQSLKPGRILPWLMLGLGAGILATFWDRLSPGATDMERYTNVSTMLVYRIMALASAILTTTVVSQEVEQKTIVYLLTRPVPRWQLLLSRWLGTVVVVVLIAWFTALCTAFSVFGPAGLSQPLLFRDLGSLALGAFAYGAVFLLVTLLVNKAMLVCLLFAFGWESSVSNMPGNMFRISIYSYLQGIAQHPRKETNSSPITDALTGGGIASLTPVGSALTLLAVVAIFMAISSFWFSSFEYVPREDAG